MSVVYFMKTAGENFSEYKRLLPIVTRRRREKIEKIIKDSDKITSLWAEVLLLGIAERICAEKPVIKIHQNGKPYFEGSKLHISISHTENAVCAAFDTEKIGVDIELVRAAELDAAKRCFTENETEYAKMSEQNFFDVWTRKEAYFKRSGEGMHFAKARELDTLAEKEIFTMHEGGYIISAACKNKPKLIVLDMPQLPEKIKCAGELFENIEVEKIF